MTPDAGTLLLQQISVDVAAMRGEVQRAMTRIEVVDAWRTNAERIHNDQETRLRLLERFRYTLAGLSVLGGAVSGYLGYVMGHYIH